VLYLLAPSDVTYAAEWPGESPGFYIFQSASNTAGDRPERALPVLPVQPSNASRHSWSRLGGKAVVIAM